MSKVTLALGSFIFGFFASWLLSGTRPSVLAQTREPEHHGINLEREPVVPGLGPHITNSTVSGSLQAIDGLDCDGCKFSDVTLEYSGGAFTLTNFSFSGPIRVNLRGAAANTLAFIQFLNALKASQQPKQPAPGKPIPMLATIKQAAMGDFKSPY
jgi:hypothetical protein